MSNKEKPENVEKNYKSFEIATNVRITLNPHPVHLSPVKYYHVLQSSAGKLYEVTSFQKKGKAYYTEIAKGSNGLLSKLGGSEDISVLKEWWKKKEIKGSDVSAFAAAMKAIVDDDKAKMKNIIEEMAAGKARVGYGESYDFYDDFDYDQSADLLDGTGSYYLQHHPHGQHSSGYKQIDYFGDNQSHDQSFDGALMLISTVSLLMVCLVICICVFLCGILMGNQCCPNLLQLGSLNGNETKRKNAYRVYQQNDDENSI